MSSAKLWKTKILQIAQSLLIFILIKENPMAIMIESKEVAESFRIYFEHIWETAKKANS